MTTRATAATPPEKSCPRTAPIKGDMGYCGEQLPSGRRLLVPHEWVDMRTAEEFWCPGYWGDTAPPASYPRPKATPGYGPIR